MDTYKDKFVALIPARGGSKGVPRKNIKLLKGYPLIAYTIAACHMSKKIGRIIVTTEDEEIADIAKRYGAEVPFLRPKQCATDFSTDYEFVNHALRWFMENEGEVPEYLVHMRPTTPLREPEIIDRALIQMENAPDYTSLRSAHKASESPYKWFVKLENGTFRSIAENIDNEMANSGRGAFPTVYIPDGYVDVLKSDFILKNGLLHGDMLMAFESPFCVEVDTPEEFEMLEYQIEKHGSLLYEFLENHYGKGVF